MKFALFYEIPVAKPWGDKDEFDAYHAVLEQAELADTLGFHSLWTVEHHFLEEYSHCSNPEVLYGAIAARTKNLRLGYGVRLMPQPYNHPIRTAESVAVLDLISNGRVEFGTGRSSSRQELEGFDIHPTKTRDMWREALRHVIGAWTEDEYQMQGEYWQMGAKRRVLPRVLQKPHPPIWAATSSEGGHRMIGELGLGLCSFAVGTPPEDIQHRIDIYREGIKKCEKEGKPIAKFINNQAATFSMVCCAPTTDEAVEVARESFEWYPAQGAKIIASVAQWMSEQDDDKALDSGNYDYTRDMKMVVESGALEHMTLDFLLDNNACVLGTPEECVEACKRYQAAGVDLLLCLINPYKIPHDKCMQSIQLFGEEVLPRFAA